MLISVALPLPLFKPLTYEVPAELVARVAPGSRVIVPVRGRREMGFVVGPAEPREGVKPKAIYSAPDAIPPLDGKLLELCRWVAHYYYAPLGMVIRTALPGALTGPESEPRQKTRRMASIVRPLPTLMERDQAFGRAKRQREAYELLESLGGSAPLELLVEQHRFTAAVVKALAGRGFIALTNEVVARDPFAHMEPTTDSKHAATRAQIAAIETLHAGKAGDVFLLHGVTGSGKTLVYLHLLRRILKQGKGAIVLVPEIALTPQTVSRFRAIFGNLVAVLHSGLSDGERYDAWLALRTGRKKIAVGARSAVFAPIQDLGAIIVDEEHESTYKQYDSVPRYHARETAIVRARIQEAIVVLGSATPSLETWSNARTGKYHMLSMPERVGGATLPFVHVVDMRTPKRDELVTTRPPSPEDLVRRVISEPLEDALRQRVARGEQAILLLNRRGYSAFIQCAECGEVDACPNCSISLTYHRAPERLLCHYCQHTEAPRDSCRRCGGAVLRQRGLGTQQVERLLVERIPDLRIARMDVDTTSRKWSHAEILDRVGKGEVDVLLGTQMIAKGLDFPNVTLVGVVDADVGINLPDFRASERCFQLLSQVAGRAGRGTKGGDVYIQTRVPRHHAVRCAVEHDYAQFVRQELEGRKEPKYPPTVRLVNVVFSGPRESDVMALAQDASDALARRLAQRGDDAIVIVGPAKCPIERIKNRWRWHLMLKSGEPASLQRAGRFLARMPVPAKGELRVVVDRDPVSLL